MKVYVLYNMVCMDLDEFLGVYLSKGEAEAKCEELQRSAGPGTYYYVQECDLHGSLEEN